MGIGSSDSPNPLVVGRVKVVRSNGVGLGHRFSPRRADTSHHVVVGSLSNIAPILKYRDRQRFAAWIATGCRARSFARGERIPSTGSGRIECAECEGFFEDPHNRGVVSVGPIEDDGSTASHSLFILVRRLWYETCGYDLLLPRARLVGAGSGLARASDE